MTAELRNSSVDAVTLAERARVLDLCSMPNEVTVALVNAERLAEGVSWRQLAERWKVSRSPYETLALRIRIARGDYRRPSDTSGVEPLAPQNADLLDALRRERTS